MGLFCNTRGCLGLESPNSTPDLAREEAQAEQLKKVDPRHPEVASVCVPELCLTAPMHEKVRDTLVPSELSA